MLRSRDGAPHDYEIRWHLDTPDAYGPNEAGAVMTRDPGVPNLCVVPLAPTGLEILSISGQRAPEILGWNFYEQIPRPATTVRHRKSGAGDVRFTTLLLPARAGVSLSLQNVEHLSEGRSRIDLSDGRRFEITVPSRVTDPLRVTPVQP